MLFALIFKSLPAKLVLHRTEVHTLRCAEGRWNKTHRKSSDFALFSLSAGQCYIPHPGGQKSDECRGPDCQGLICGFYQVPKGVWNSSSQFSRSVMAHEGSGEEATCEEGEAWGVSDPCAPRLAEETHLTCPSPQRVQGHGLFLILQVTSEKFQGSNPSNSSNSSWLFPLSLFFLARLLFAASYIPFHIEAKVLLWIHSIFFLDNKVHCTTNPRHVEERGMCLLLELQCHSCGVS